jgi:hypothetical protein
MWTVISVVTPDKNVNSWYYCWHFYQG